MSLKNVVDINWSHNVVLLYVCVDKKVQRQNIMSTFKGVVTNIPNVNVKTSDELKYDKN